MIHSKLLKEFLYMKLLKNILLWLILFVSSFSFGKTIHIAIIDTGFSPQAFFTNDTSYLPSKFCSVMYFYDNFQLDLTNHGSFMVSILSKRLNDANIDYCIHLYAWDPRNEQTYFQALEYVSQHINSFDVLNLSLGGLVYNDNECRIIKKILRKGKTIVAAAGNNGINIDETSYYPASCDKRIYRIMNGTSPIQRRKSSNFTSIHGFYEEGNNIPGLNFQGKRALISGTSVSAVIFTANFIINKYNKK